MKFFTIIFLLVLANLGLTQSFLSNLFNENPFNNFTSQYLNATVTIISEPEFAKSCATTDLQNNSLAQLIFAASVFYLPLHDSICFENKKSTFCWDEFARNLYGLPNSKHLVYASSDTFYGSCTLCSKAIVNTILNFITTNHFAQLIISKMNIDISVIKNSISVICGNSFVNGTVIDPKTGKTLSPLNPSTSIFTTTTNPLPISTLTTTNPLPTSTFTTFTSSQQPTITQ
ncbi:hypothetical protein F8M41_001041 [Gigaspora margarita]|uniref:Uncharacterized protein n=1 Tax=Gigaspora margarita TaxID=4874 RepID=A0A8H4A8E2_GIGMA|nr:hypothetical protein F8M41_001041 [Gigaspora margarita]